ncbi:MAG: ATP-dependent DNA helicase RecQ [Myxococcota bacterium]
MVGHSAEALISTDHETRLRSCFGLEAFRPWQREAVEALLDDNQPVLVVAPTGGGKSLTYQYPASQLEGTTIVISPLIALMEDQVRGLQDRGIAATYLASTLDRSELNEREAALRRGEYRLVYVAPERLANDFAVSMLQSLNPPLVAIDEAHCISQWGHDFRPDYLRIGEVLARLKPRHVLACTATATPRVRDEIVERLGMQNGRVILRGFARPNLHLRAELLETPKQRRAAMSAALRENLGDPRNPAGGAIVYAATRKNTERFAEHVAGLGYRSAAYHAGLPAEKRNEVGLAFARGELDVVVATNAFGMGIDRADIRLVVHVEAPGSIEAYYQEVGRAGRDGAPARGLLLSASADLGLRRRLIERPWEGGARSSERIQQQWSMFLDLMRYAEAGSCRHDFILRYFGDEAEILGGCGHCDICLALEDGETTGESSPEDALVVRKALAGVARARGRVGMKAIADMLAGKDNAKVRRQGFDRLSTFGILGEHKVDWVVQLLRRLVTAGYAAIDAREYPLLYITKKGAAVMKDEEPARIVLPAKRAAPKARSSKESAPAVSDPLLFEALRQVRKELADAAHVPAYVVCSNRTLGEIADRKPNDLESLGEVHGMGPARVEQYGERLLEAVRSGA